MASALKPLLQTQPWLDGPELAGQEQTPFILLYVGAQTHVLLAASQTSLPLQVMHWVPLKKEGGLQLQVLEVSLKTELAGQRMHTLFTNWKL